MRRVFLRIIFLIAIFSLLLYVNGYCADILGDCIDKIIEISPILLVIIAIAIVFEIAKGFTNSTDTKITLTKFMDIGIVTMVLVIIYNLYIVLKEYI